MSNVKKVIDDWDPIGLFPLAPSDEYSIEIIQIEELILSTQEICTIAKEIMAIFTTMFGDTVFRCSYDECLKIAYMITNGSEDS